MTPALAGRYGLLLIVRISALMDRSRYAIRLKPWADLQEFVIDLLGDEPIASISTVSSAASPLGIRQQE